MEIKKQVGVVLIIDRGQIGRKYFVIYDKMDSNINDLFVCCPVPDTLIDIPKEGWDKIPIPEYQKKVDSIFDKRLNDWLTQFFPR